jgi:hypothetical protein
MYNIRAGICSVVEQSLKIVKMHNKVEGGRYSFSFYENIGLFYKAI